MATLVQWQPSFFLMIAKVSFDQVMQHRYFTQETAAKEEWENQFNQFNQFNIIKNIHFS